MTSEKCFNVFAMVPESGDESCHPARNAKLKLYHALYPMSDVAHIFESRDKTRATRPNISGWNVLFVGVARVVAASTTARVS